MSSNGTQATASEWLLELRGVTVQYGAARALTDVSYRVAPASIVCLLGGNASGKSTSMKAIFGTVGLVSGEVWFDGRRIDRLSTPARVRAGIAAVPEGRRVFAHMSVEDNLMIGAGHRREKAQVRRDLDDAFATFPRLADRRHQQAGTMSGGEQQMLAMARALMSAPRVICMDEPSMGLAPVLVRQSFALIERFRERGIAVFVVEQNANAALRIADYAYVLQTGRLVLEGPPDHVAADPAMREAYLGHRTKETA